jgi:hypothetical protein
LNNLYFLFEACDETADKKNATKRIVFKKHGRKTRRERA